MPWGRAPNHGSSMLPVVHTAHPAALAAAYVPTTTPTAAEHLETRLTIAGAGVYRVGGGPVGGDGQGGR